MENNTLAPEQPVSSINQPQTPIEQQTNDIPEKKPDKLLKISLYVLAALVLLASGAFGFFVYQERVVKKPLPSPPLTPEPTPEGAQSGVVITTDKRVYEQGGKVTATLKYENEIYQWGNSAWLIQKLENESWVTIRERGNLYFFCANIPECKDINFDEVEECPLTVLCERPMWYKVREMPKDMLSFTWDQSYKVKERTFQCKTGKIEREETWTCAVFNQVPPGKYKVRFEYTLSINLDDRFDRNIDIKYAEKEFTILGSSPEKCNPVANPCLPNSCDYDPVKCEQLKK